MYVSFLHNRFQVRRTGQTLFEMIQHCVYEGVVFSFSGSVIARLPNALDLSKLEKRWIEGIYFGKRPDSDASITTSLYVAVVL